MPGMAHAATHRATALMTVCSAKLMSMRSVFHGGGRVGGKSGVLVAGDARLEHRVETEQVGLDRLEGADGVRDGHPLDAALLEGDHLAPGPVEGGLDSGDPETRAEHAVEGDGRATALDVAEGGHAALDAGAALDLAGEDRADATEDLVAVLVDLGRRDLHGARLGHRPFRDDDDGGEAALLVAVDDPLADLVDVEGLLRHERDGGASGEARPDRDVADVPAHDLDDEDAVVRLGRRVEAVDGVRADLHGRLEAERHLGQGDVVVDRLRHPDDGEPVLVQAVDDTHRARAAEGQDAAAPVDVEDLVVVVHDPAPRVAEADDGAVVRDLGGAGGAPDDGVEAGTVPAPGEDADAHDLTFGRAGHEQERRGGG